MKLMSKISLLIFAFAALGMSAGQTISPVCEYDQGGNCWVNVLDYMDNEYEFSANSTTYSASSDPASARNASANSSVIKVTALENYLIGDTACNPAPGCRVVLSLENDAYWGGIKYLFVSPADGLRFMVKQSDGLETPEVFRYDSDSIYVMSEPRADSETQPNWRYAGYWQHPGENITFADRGYLWTNTPLIMTRLTPNLLRSDFGASYRLTTPLSGGMVYSRDDLRVPGAFWEHNPLGTSVNQYIYLDMYEGVTDANAVPVFGEVGNLPGPLDILVLVHGTQSQAGQEIWMERYFYARHREYGPLGLIRWDSWLLDTSVCPATWTPDPQYTDAECWGQMALRMRIHNNKIDHIADDSEYDNNAELIAELMQTVNGVQHDTKLAVRYPNDWPAPGAVDADRPHLRGGFIQPGIGKDASGWDTVIGSWVFLENNNFAQDYYFYRQDGRECRENYGLRGSLDVPGVWSGLDRSFYWDDDSTAILCGTSWDVYIGGFSCAFGYAERGYYYSTRPAQVCNPATGNCVNQAANNWVSLCVKE